MKNKNLSLLAIAMIALFSMTLTSCGDESEDPQPTPTKTDLEKVQEAVAGSTWTLLSAEIEANGNTYFYNGDCDFSMFPSTAIAANATDFQYTFAAGGTVTYTEQCGSQTGNKPYTVTQAGDVFTITYTHGSSTIKFEILNDIEDITDSEITVLRTTPLAAGVTSAKLTFVKS